MARKKAEKRPRRKPGTGTIRHRPGRLEPFEAAYKISGEYLYHSFQSHEDATAWLDSLHKDNQEGTRDIAGGAMLVQDYLPMWLELRRAHVAPKTLQAYQYYCEYACGEGRIGRLKLDDVTVLIAQRMVNRLAEGGFQNTPQLKSVLFQAFKYASKSLHYIRTNVFEEVSAPPIERKEGIALTKSERARMLDTAAHNDTIFIRRKYEGMCTPPPMLPFWHLCSRLALRRGEADALKWSSVDMDTATATISATRGRVGAGHIEGKTKTKKVRIVPLPADVVELLKAHKAAQMRAALAYGWRWSEKGYVFVDERTGHPIAVDHIAYRWRCIRKAANLPARTTIHDLRVTALTILALDGVPENVRMELAGHATSTMAGHYANHAALEDVRRAVGT